MTDGEEKNEHFQVHMVAWKFNYEISDVLNLFILWDGAWGKLTELLGLLSSDAEVLNSDARCVDMRLDV